MKINSFLEGKKLYGDDFSPDQIKEWFDKEKEGYADLGSKVRKQYKYPYHYFNILLGYNKINKKNFKNVLGLGSAYGDEFEPIIDKISNLTIIEPSDNLLRESIGDIVPNYVKPTIDGVLPFEDGTYDLINTFGTLHHIPNVSFVLAELIRVLEPGGYLLVREPITSMGDWTKPRPGLTENERGIPIKFFDELFEKYDVSIEGKSYCFTASSFIMRKLGKYFKRNIFSYKIYVIIDKFISSLLKNRVKYHAKTAWERIAPTSIFYVIRKNS